MPIWIEESARLLREAMEAAWSGLKADHRAASSYQRNQEYKGSKKGYKNPLGLISNPFKHEVYLLFDLHEVITGNL